VTNTEAPEEARVLARLAQAGLDGIPSLSALAQSGVKYDTVVPILIASLDDTDDPRVKEWIVRCLSVPWAKAAGGHLVELLPTAAHKGQTALAWATGNAIGVLANPRIAPSMVDLVLDETLGAARQMIVLALPRVDGVIDAESVLLRLVSDPEVNGHAVVALARLSRESSRPVLERAATDDRPWVRQAAKRGLKKLGDPPR
jgi:HEAT repeat protein